MTHPARSALFVSFVITEMLESRFNTGQRSNLYYWRDRSGNEIDVIIDEGLQLFPVEIKSARPLLKRSGGIVVRSWQDVQGLP